MRLTRVVQDLSHELGRSPSLDEIVHALDVDVEAVLEAMEGSYATSHLDVPWATTRPMGDSTACSDGSIRAWRQSTEVAVGDLLASLPKRDRQIVHLWFFEGLTQSEIASRIGLSQMHVSRLLTKSLASLRELLSEP